LETVLVTDFK